MLQIKLINHSKTWENFLLNNNHPSFLQSYFWGEFHRSLGHKIFRLGFYQNKKLKGIALVIYLHSHRGPYFECPAGPVIPFKPSYFSHFIKAVRQLTVKYPALFIRIRPNCFNSQDKIKQLNRLGFIKAPMHLHAESTWVLDLDLSCDQLLKNMRKNTRRAILKADKLKVKVTTSTALKDINLLYRLQLQTVDRRHFVPFSKDYFRKQFLAFKKNNHIKLFKASYQGEVLAISFIIFYGQEAIYHYSGSSSYKRHIPASYALQWAAIKEAKRRGLSLYNFWGYTDNPHHRFYGPSLFKKGFGGRPVQYLPAHDLPLSFFYWPVFLFETLRRKHRKL